jgi:hypothetical protein
VVLVTWGTGASVQLGMRQVALLLLEARPRRFVSGLCKWWGRRSSAENWLLSLGENDLLGKKGDVTRRVSQTGDNDEDFGTGKCWPVDIEYWVKFCLSCASKDKTQRSDSNKIECETMDIGWMTNPKFNCRFVSLRLG